MTAPPKLPPLPPPKLSPPRATQQQLTRTGSAPYHERSATPPPTRTRRNEARSPAPDLGAPPARQHPSGEPRRATHRPTRPDHVLAHTTSTTHVHATFEHG